MITGHTQVYGLFGNPVKQSFSPFIHNMFAKELNIDMTYVPFCVEKGLLSKAVEGIEGLNLRGLNVTVPYKLEIIPFLDEIQGEARVIGAVNTIVRKDHQLIGYNTDWIGLKKSLEVEQVTLEGKNVLILGAGGSAKAVAVMCATGKVKELVIANRTLSKAQTLAASIRDQYNLSCTGIELDEIRSDNDFQIIIQTTSIGMAPYEGLMPIKEGLPFKQAEVAVDLIYNPQTTAFLDKMKRDGVRTFNGLGMLFYQAVAAFELWHNIEMDETIQDRCLKSFIGAMNEKLSR